MGYSEKRFTYSCTRGGKKQPSFEAQIYKRARSSNNPPDVKSTEGAAAGSAVQLPVTVCWGDTCVLTFISVFIALRVS